jgi:hypothetical protein
MIRQNGYRFCVDIRSRRPEVAEQARRLVGAGENAGIDEVLGVQAVDEDSDEIAFVEPETGLIRAEDARFIPYSAISRTHSEYADK